MVSVPESSSSDPFPAPLLKQIVEETRKFARSRRLELPRTAEVFGPDSYFWLLSASSGGRTEVGDDLRGINSPFYLVLLRGHFMTLRGPSRSFPIAILIWSPNEEHLHWSLMEELPATMSRLGPAQTVSLE